MAVGSTFCEKNEFDEVRESEREGKEKKNVKEKKSFFFSLLQ
jgi:hypothetical protein